MKIRSIVTWFNGKGKGEGDVEGMGGGREKMNEGLKRDGRGMRLVLGP